MRLTKLCSIIVTKWNNLNNKIQEIGNVFCNIPVLVITELLTRPFKNFITNDLSIKNIIKKDLPVLVQEEFL